MNIWGYQKKAKRMTRMLQEEEDKKRGKSLDKIERLMKAKNNCLTKIKELKKNVKKKDRRIRRRR